MKKTRDTFLKQDDQTTEILAKRVASVFVFGGLSTPLWWLLIKHFLPTADDPVWLRVITMATNLIFAYICYGIKPVRKYAEEVSLISTAFYFVTNAFWIKWNNHHPIYVGMFFIAAISAMLAIQRRFSILVLGGSIAGAAMVGDWSQTAHWIFFSAVTSAMVVLGIISNNRISWLERLDEQTTLLQEKNRFIESVTETVPASVHILSLKDGSTLFKNSKLATMMGYQDPESMTMANWQELVHPEDEAVTAAAFAKLGRDPVEIEFRLRHQAGHYFWARSYWTIFSVDVEGLPAALMAVTLDITKQREMLQKLEQERARVLFASKMSSLGEMAGGIAHEVNNPLAIISAMAERVTYLSEEGLAAEFTAKNSTQKILTETKTLGERIQKTSLRIASIIRGLRSFARDADKDPFLAVSVAQVMEDVLEFCKARFESHGVRLEVDVIDRSVTVEARGAQVAQVVLNLLNNAFDAVVDLPNPWVRLAVVHQEHRVEIRVVDSGPGISKEIRERVMEPFFTTKEPGKGTGLGLSIADGIVQSHGGKLWIDNNAKHMTFVIDLPKKQAKNPEIKQAVA